jgi:hypothetical protein
MYFSHLIFFGSPYPFMLFMLISKFLLYSDSSDEVQSDDVLKTGPSTIDKRKRKKRYAKKPCNSEERLNLIVATPLKLFTIIMLLKCCLEILRKLERQGEHRLPKPFTF